MDLNIKNSDKQKLTKMAEKVVKFGMSVPTIFFLESAKYMSFLGSQTLVFFGPIMTIFIQSESYYKVTDLLEERNNIEFLMIEIERIEGLKNNKVVK